MADKYYRMTSEYEWAEVSKSEYETSIQGDPDAPNNRGIVHHRPEGATFITLDVANIALGDLMDFIHVTGGDP
jgi:hypothetical protein